MGRTVGKAPSQPAGWYPDPLTAGRHQLRCWTGTAWGDVRPAGPPRDAPPPVPPPPVPAAAGRSRKRPGCLTTFVTLVGLVVAIVVVAVALSRQDVESVKIAGSEIHFKASAPQIKENQPEIKQKVAENTEQARRSGASAPTPEVDLTGMWVAGDPSFTYRFDQYGDQVVFQEISPYGVTATGQGVLSGRQLTLSFTAIDRSTGSVRLTVGSSGWMSGQVVNDTHGTTAGIGLRRIG